MLAFTYDITRAKKRIAEVKSALRGDGGRARPAYDAAGMSVLADLRSDYITKARGGAAGDRWQDIAPITKLLRPGPKVSSWSDLAGQKTEIGRSTGGQFASLTRGAPGNIFAVGQASVTIGSNLSQAARFHAGGPTSDAGFIVTPAMYQRARKRVAKPRRLAKSQRSLIAQGKDPNDSQAALRAFNRQVFGILFGMEAGGARPNQPARPIVPEPRSRTPKAWIKRAADQWWQVMQRIIGRI